MARPGKTVNVIISVDKAIKDELQRRAKHERRSMSNYVTLLLEHALNSLGWRHPEHETEPEFKDFPI